MKTNLKKSLAIAGVLAAMLAGSAFAAQQHADRTFGAAFGRGDNLRHFIADRNNIGKRVAALYFANQRFHPLQFFRQSMNFRHIVRDDHTAF